MITFADARIYRYNESVPLQEMGRLSRFMDERTLAAANTAVDPPMEELTGTAYFEAMYEKYANDVLRVSYFYLGDRQ